MDSSNVELSQLGTFHLLNCTATSQHVRSDMSVSVTRRGIKGVQVNNAKHRGVCERTTQALE